ncbi:GGDEF domain-containing protein [uncultured Desulfovibrio sp.]|uniref:GGDEF domain-containing protein n=1 Tax=uncultured Desulfovibrio sp. TaxID=167968 RepID=UPI00260E8A9C|nr:GGDEF domain-containing protein [uncultured Desulfovibrio sp.]
MSNNTEFNALTDELLAFQRMSGATAGGRGRKGKDRDAVLVARLLPGMDLGRWREFSRNNLSGRWCALPVGPALLSEPEDAGAPDDGAHLAHLLLNELVTGQIQRELLRLARTGGELALMEATLLGREELARQLPPKTLDALDAGLFTCLTQCREECDSLGNTGPGRYVLLLPGVGLLHARLMAEDVQKKFAALAATLCNARGGRNAVPPACAVGIVCADPHERPSPSLLLQQCEHALREALAQRQGHISIAGGEALDKRTTLVHSSEKRFLFFGSN